MSARRAVPDEEQARRLAIEDLERNLFVEAGAGAGKTTILVARLIRLVRTGKARITEVAAVTFTEKAAGELLERVRGKLEEAIEEKEMPPPERERLEEALDDLERAPISTIHGLAGSILRERPLEARLDPSFRPLDETRATFAREEAWEAWLPGALERDPGPVRRALRAGVKLESRSPVVPSIQRLAFELLANRDRPPGLVTAGEPDLVTFVERWRDHQERLEDLLAACQDPADRAAAQIVELRERLRAARSIIARREGAPEALEAVLRNLQIKPSGGSQQNWRPKDACREAKEVLGELEAARAAAVAALDHEVVSGLAAWLQGFVKHAVEAFRARGLLTFQDHLVECRDLLRDHLGARRWFQERFRAIFLDEFQDTDPLQVEIAFFLAEKEPRARDWREVVLEPGKLFIVGDPKQSIYRFRRADIELYEEVRERIREDGEVLSIRRNHRSVPGVLDWVNRTFGALIQKPADGSYQPDYQPLLPYRDPAEGPAVQDLKAGADLEGKGMDEARRHEAERVADLVQVHGSVAGRWSEVAILFPRSSGLLFLEEALRRRGIPYHLEGGKEFFKRQEVAAVLNCLEALERPEDEVALVAALKSSVFGHNDAEVLGLVAEGGRLSYLHEAPRALAATPLARSLSFLRELHAERNRLPMAKVVARLVEETGAAPAAALRRLGGLSASQNLRKLVTFARRFDADGEEGASFGRFARWLRIMDEDGGEEAESPTFEAHEEAVRLLTIHKSKGLQFKVVILANLSSGSSRGDPFIWLPDRLELKLGDLKTHGHEAARERERARQEAERKRLLYVAATRAEDRLVISTIADKVDGELRHLIEHPAPEEVDPPPSPSVPEEEAVEARAEEARIETLARDVRERPERIRKEYRPPRAIRPSEEGEEDLMRGEGSGPARDRDAARALGKAIHRTLELALGPDPGELLALARRAAAEESLTGKVEEIAAHAARALALPSLARARRSGRVRREVEILVDVQGEGELHGKVDLLYEVDGGWGLIDFKTGLRKDGDAKQVCHYRRAIREITGRPVREAFLVYTKDGQELPVPEDVPG